MKICLISNLFPPISRGGAEKVAETVAQGLREAGHEVFVISTKPWSGWMSLKPEIKEENGLKIYRFYPLNFFYYLNDWRHNALFRLIWHFFDIFNCHSPRVVKKILKEEKPEIVMTHNLKGIGYLIPRIIHKLSIKHIHTLHDVQLSVPSGLIIKGQENNWQQRTRLRKIYESICRRLIASPEVVISPSKWLLDFYSEKRFFKNSKKVVLPNPIPPNVIAMAPSGARRTKQSQSNEIATLPSVARNNKLSLLYLGQIEEHKGILFLVDVLKKLNIDFKLHIAGDGSKMEEVKKMAENDQHFMVHGKLSSEEVAKIFSEVDLTIVPSLCYENSPSVIYESLSFGVPVLAAKIGGAAELVHDGKNGFTFEAGNAEDLARFLKYVAANRDELQKMCSFAAKSVENFKIKNYINTLVNLLKV